MPPPHNLVALPFISMHGSTWVMVDHLTVALIARDIRGEHFNLTVTHIGKRAMALVDAGAIIVVTLTVHTGPRPFAAHAAFLATSVDRVSIAIFQPA